MENTFSKPLSIFKCTSIFSCVTQVKAVVVGFDGHVSFMKIMRAASYLNDPKIPYIATNTDGRLPTKTGRVIPG